MSCEMQILFQKRFVNVYFTPNNLYENFGSMCHEIRILSPCFGTEGTCSEPVPPISNESAECYRFFCQAMARNKGLTKNGTK